jgi:hypothetical protein
MAKGTCFFPFRPRLIEVSSLVGKNIQISVHKYVIYFIA